MNSKMTVLAAVLVVGVLAAAGIGYAYTAQYTSDDNVVTANYAYVIDLSAADIDYNTEHNDKTDVFKTLVTTPKNTITVAVNTAALDALDGDKKYDVAVSGVKITFSDGTNTGTWDGTTLVAGDTGASACTFDLAATSQTVNGETASENVILTASGDATGSKVVYISAIEFTLTFTPQA